MGYTAKAQLCCAFAYPVPTSSWRKTHIDYSVLLPGISTQMVTTLTTSNFRLVPKKLEGRA
jgi:hypothetical protein